MRGHRTLLASTSMRLVARFALGLARTNLGGRAVGGLARFVPFAVPRLVHIDRAMIVFRHPVAGAPHHLLALPRRFVADARVADESSRAFWDSFEQWLVRYAPRSSTSLLCITNLGRNQEVGLLHVHVMDTWPKWFDAAEAEEYSPSLLGVVEKAAGRFAGMDKRAFAASIVVPAQLSAPDGWRAVTRLAQVE